MVVLRDATTTTTTTAGTEREELYRQFYVHRRKMGDPTSMRSPEEVFGTKASGMVSFFLKSFFRQRTKVKCFIVEGKEENCEWGLVVRSSVTPTIDGPDDGLDGWAFEVWVPNIFFCMLCVCRAVIRSTQVNRRSFCTYLSGKPPKIVFCACCLKHGAQCRAVSAAVALR